MPIDFRLINGLFDCESCLREQQCDDHADRSGIRACDVEDKGGKYYKPDPAYKRKEKPDQSSDTSH